MKVNYLTLLAGAAMVLLSAATTRAEESAASVLAADANTAPAAKAQTTTTAQVAAYRSDTVDYCDDCDPVRDFIVRAGAWGVHQSGSPTMIGEYQDLQSSPFWDVDGIFSNGSRTIDATVTGNDNETTDARIRGYFGSLLSVDLQYDRFLHQMQSDNFAGFLPQATNQANPALPPNPITNVNLFTLENRNPNQNYAYRVQEFKANFKGNLTENLKWKVNVFGIDKEGERQANTVAHCYQDMSLPNPSPAPPAPPNTLRNQCHVTSQSQQISWRTTQIEPVFELRVSDNLRMEYSHTIRTFEQSDSLVSANYNRAVTAGYATTNGGLDGVAGYAFVPNSTTQIDRLKIGGEIGCATDYYVLGYAGYNKNELRDFSRNFNGADARITNSAIDNLKVTGYGKYYREETGGPSTALNTLYPSMANAYREPNLSLAEEAGIGRESHAVGLNGRWTPFKDDCGTFRSRMALVSGYEYSTLQRTNVEYETSVPLNPSAGTASANTFFTQPDTNKNTFVLGVEEKWSACFDTYIRYKFISTKYPLYGVTAEVNNSLDGALNSNLPTQENRIEVGGTWSPTDNLMVSATIYVENAMSNAPYVGAGPNDAGWTSNSLPFVLSSWWAPTRDWSLSVGFAEMNGWINQGVTLAQLSPSVSPVEDAVSVPWKYNAMSDVFTAGTRYAVTEKLILSGDFELVRGTNSSYAMVNPALSSPQPNFTVDPYPIGGYSLVKMQSVRLGAGVDYILRPRVTTFARYNYYDYQDLSNGLTSGQAHMLLGGMSALF